jgi:hypothetical protein
MKTRASQGSTLSLIVACTLCLALLGIGFIILSMIFGGHRESQHAADSGSLNVSKRAILAPYVDPTGLTTDVGRAMAANLTAPSGSNVNMGSGVNLLNFNRMVAQALLVGLNADAEGSGQANAQVAFDYIEGSSASVGAQLKTLLSDSNWAKTDYEEVQGNVLRMLGAQGAPAFNSSDFQVAYLNQRQGDFNGTNIDMSSYDSNNKSSYNQNLMPISDYSGAGPFPRDNFPTSTFSHASGNNGTSYLSGYNPIQIGSGASGLKFYAVSTNPGQQPHLESNTTFSQQLTQPGDGSVYLPPNTFRIGAEAAVTPANGSTGNAHVLSISTIGTPQSPFQASIPGGYIVIDNSDKASFSGAIPNTDNVAADELGTGILVDKATGYFSYGSGPADKNGKPTANLIDQWQQYDHDPNNFKASSSDPPYKGIYDKTGSALTSADQAAKIPYVPNPSQQHPPSILCTDNNSSNPGGDSDCVQHASTPAGGGLDPFDKAYHPNTQAANGSISTNSATAAELAQCKVLDLYGPTAHGGGPAEAYNFTFGPTGLRKYPNGIPSDSNQYAWQGPNGHGFAMAPDAPYAGTTTKSSNTTSCQVTVDGTMQDLFEQTEPGSYAAVRAFLVQRMLEILPSGKEANGTLDQNWAGGQETDSILSTKLSLGSTYYIYLKNGTLTIDTTGPAYVNSLSAAAKLPDGKKHGPAPKTYTILQGVANPYYAYGIHDRLFTTWGDDPNASNSGGDITATDTAFFQPSSGAYGMLGLIKFTETSQSSGSLAFNNRD